MDKREFNARGEAFCAILQKRLHGFDYVTIIKNGLFNSNPPHYQITVRFEPNALKDTNVIVGRLVYHGITYLVYRGERGGLYFWKRKSRGPHQGEYYKKYCSHLSISPVNGGGNYWRKNVIKGLIDRICAESWEYETQCHWDEQACAFIISLFDKAQTKPQSDEEGGGFDEDGEFDEDEEFEDGEDREDEDGEDEDREDDDREDEDEEYDEDGEFDEDKEFDGDSDGEEPEEEDDDDDEEDDDKCPVCGAPVFEMNGIQCCTECDWQEDDGECEDDDVCPECGSPIFEMNGIKCCTECDWQEDEVCPECGAPIFEMNGIKCCTECDWQEEEVCPECGAPIFEINGIKCCTECDWNEEGASFEKCPSCGAPIFEMDDIKHCTVCDWDERDDWGSDEWREYYENR